MAILEQILTYNLELIGGSPRERISSVLSKKFDQSKMLWDTAPDETHSVLQQLQVVCVSLDEMHAAWNKKSGSEQLRFFEELGRETKIRFLDTCGRLSGDIQTAFPAGRRSGILGSAHAFSEFFLFRKPLIAQETRHECIVVARAYHNMENFDWDVYDFSKREGSRDGRSNDFQYHESAYYYEMALGKRESSAHPEETDDFIRRNIVNQYICIARVNLGNRYFDQHRDFVRKARQEIEKISDPKYGAAADVAAIGMQREISRGDFEKAYENAVSIEHELLNDKDEFDHNRITATLARCYLQAKIKKSVSIADRKRVQDLIDQLQIPSSLFVNVPRALEVLGLHIPSSVKRSGLDALSL